jgi:hypothetical protein
MRSNGEFWVEEEADRIIMQGRAQAEYLVVKK